jgi:hypothetical protein
MSEYDRASMFERKIEKIADSILSDVGSWYTTVIWPGAIRVKIKDRRWDINWKNQEYKISYNKREIAVVKDSSNAATEVLMVIKKNHDELAAKYEQLHMKKAVKFSDIRKLILTKMVNYCKERGQKCTIDWIACTLEIPHPNDVHSYIELEISTLEKDTRIVIQITINPNVDGSSRICWNIESILISDPNFDPDKIVGLLDLAIKKKTDYEQYYKKIFTDVNDFLGKTGCIIDNDGGQEE